MSNSGGINPATGNASLQSLFASLRKQSSDPNSFDAEPFGTPDRQQRLSEAINTRSGGSSKGTPPPFSFFGSGPSMPQTRPSENHQPTVSSPIPSPDHRGPQPHHQSAIMSPNLPTPSTTSPATVTGQPNADRTAKLLNLLKLNPSAPTSSGAHQHDEISGQRSMTAGNQDTYDGKESQSGPSRGISASDLVASFMGGNKPPTPGVRTPAKPTGSSKVEVSRDFSEPASSPSAHTQDFLLQLLNQPKTSQSDEGSSILQAEKALSPQHEAPEATADDVTQDLADASLARVDSGPSQSHKSPLPGSTTSSPHVFRGNDNTHAFAFDGTPTSQKTAQSIFTYQNPFDQLAASSPLNRTPRHDQPRSGSGTPSVEVRKSSQTPQNGSNGTESAKRKNQGSPPGLLHESARKKPSGVEGSLPVLSSPPPPVLPDGRSQVEALMGIGANHKDPETVAHALTEVGEQVNQEVEQALAETERTEGTHAAADAQQEVWDELQDEVKDVAAQMKTELEKDENEGALEEALPKPVAGAVKDLIDGAAQAQAAENWDSADEGENRGRKPANHVVRVYNFPMKPFSTLVLQSLPYPNPVFRDDCVMDIARLKKEFDQVDRTLATATKDFIIYGMSKNGGFRVIRQDDGRDKQVFAPTKDRIFTLSSTTAPSGTSSAGFQSVLATGISGTVYWLPLVKNREDLFENEDLERHRIIFPPTASQEESTSGGQLKTRARKSSRHPEFFAVGRGKAIHIVWPSIAGSSKYLSNRKERIVDTTKYLHERCLKIATGKAGKDFTFSEDDTVVASLDKLGRLRMWDIRELTNEVNAVAKGSVPTANPPLEIKSPIITFLTTSPAEKAWPSSVMFLDKSRPYARGVALRYMIIGMKQNHTLQLWDLALGRATQELNLPHSNESDAICSVVYHHPSNMIVVGHPTRNSIYFVHLSAPRYNLSPMAQARYLERLTQNDPSLPKPDVTAIMSGFREYSFATKGQLRSIDILSQPSALSDDPDNSPVFELYIMHSKGVSCLSIAREDLGWSKDSKVLHPVDGVEEGVVRVEDLREIPPPSESPPNQSSAVNGDQPSTASASATSLPLPSSKTSKPSPKPVFSSTTESGRALAPDANDTDLRKKEDKSDTTLATPVFGAQESAGNVPDKQEKRKKKRAGGDNANRGTDEMAAANLSSVQPPSYSQAAQQGKAAPTPASSVSHKTSGQLKPQKVSTPSGEEKEHSPMREGRPSTSDIPSINMGISGEFLDKEIRKIEKSVSGEFTKVMSRELGNIYRRFDEDKRIQQAAGDAKQDAVLRLVSSTLSENVEKSLARMIGQNIQQSVLPAIANVTENSLNRHISDAIRNQFHLSLSRELRSALPEIVGRAFQSPDVLRHVSDLVADKVAVHVESEFSSVLHGTISPAFKQLALDAAKKIAGEVERRTAEQIRVGDLQRHNDSQKIDQLHDLVRGLTQTVSRMADAQSDFQSEILKLQRQLNQSSARRSDVSGTPSTAQERAGSPRQVEKEPTPEKTPEQEEHDTIVDLMRQGRYEEATIKWLQSERQAELFDSFFVRCGPEYVQTLSPLVLLSVAASITSSLETHVGERMNWLSSCFSSINATDSDVRDVLPKIMDVLVQRLEGLYMRIAETNLQDPLLKKIPPLTRIAKELKLAG
ncbi:MAG: hypothetical protein M1837_007441 [Sclerophora amabilis]|nr:MAG: hypothetical protein M1837_007441 [Sclerophora amabilis]